MEADNLVAIALGRDAYHLPYVYAQISLRTRRDKVLFRHQRMEWGKAEAEFSAAYSPTSEPYIAQPGTLEHWLTERYCCFGVNAKGRLCRADIHHLPWRLQRASAYIRTNTIASSCDIELPTQDPQLPLLHYSHYIKAYIWPIKWLPTRPL
jgi:uncharacterized protein